MDMKFKNNLKKIRKSKGITATKLAEELAKAGIVNPTKQRIAKIEAGIQQMSGEEAAVYARVLGVSVEEILYEALPEPLNAPYKAAAEQARPAKNDKKKTPHELAHDFASQVLALCREMPPEAALRVNVDQLAADIKELFGHVRETPLKPQKKIG